MPDLVIEFDCNNVEERAEEFQHHLLERKIVPSGVQKEVHEGEIWLSYPNVQADMIRRIAQEAHPWCLDRGLSLLQNASEAPARVTLMIADLSRVME